MKRMMGTAAAAFYWGLLMASTGAAGDAILPQGDPRLRSTPAEEAMKETRDSRLAQQGQGERYRVDGEMQGGSSGSTVGDPNGLARQDTGLADPSVNPGQASGMQRVQGRIVQSDEQTHTVRQPTGGDKTITVDDETRGDKDLKPGDLIFGTVTPQGRAVIVQKVPKGE